MKNRYRLLSLLFGVAFVMTGLFGCGSDLDELVVATVNGDKILARDINDIFTRSGSTFFTFDEELQARTDILDSLIIQQLYIQEAYRRNIDKLDEVNRIVLDNREKFLLDILYERQINDKIVITDDEVRDLYEKQEYKISASHILLGSEDSAWVILDSLKNGGNFEDLAVSFSKDPTTSRNRGQLGYFDYASKDHQFAQYAFRLNPGEISEPFKTRYGWHIVKVHDRIPNEDRRTFEDAKAGLRRSLEVNKRMDLIEKYSLELKEKYPVKVEKDVCDYVLHRLEMMYPPQILQNIPKSDFDLGQLDRDEKEMVLATWNGGQMTLGQYLVESKKLAQTILPPFNNYDSIGVIIFNLRIDNVLGTEARKLGLEDDPLFKYKLKRFKELAMADVFENDSLPFGPQPDDGEVRQYYESHPEEFITPAKVHLFEIYLSDFTLAKNLNKSIVSFKQFKEAAAKYTERPGKRATSGDLGYITEQQYPDLFRAAQNTNVGDIAGPLGLGGGKFSLIYVADKQAEEVVDFLTIKEKIRRQLNIEKRKKVRTDWIAAQKDKSQIKIYEGNLRSTIDKSKYEKVG